ncbi:hypothetical protein HYDPIDRAFT_22922 [Hydnomerulius pinastri MD-312]|nr:hypothetical protein HYDPIDRAFT_22922 [Hydnomerulius pinastri MD-312]
MLPDLRTFVTTKSLTKSLVHFLNRNPKVTRLALSSPVLDTNASVGFPTIHLPDLNQLSIPSTAIPLFSFDAPIRQVCITWQTTDHDYDARFKTVAKSSKQELSIKIMICHLTFSQSGPSTHQGGQSVSDDEFLNAVGAALREWQPENLRHLMCCSIEHYAGAHTILASLYDSDFARVREWGENAPNLTGAVLPSDLTWFRIKGAAWILDMSRSLSKRWLFKVLRERSYPFVEIVTPILKIFRKTQGLYDPLQTWRFREVPRDTVLPTLGHPVLGTNELMSDDAYYNDPDDEEEDDPTILRLMEAGGVLLGGIFKD